MSHDKNAIEAEEANENALPEGIITYQKTKTTKFFRQICIINFCFGSPNYWFEELDVPMYAKKIQPLLSKFLHFLVIFTIFFMIGAIFTQHSLSTKQKSDLPLFINSYILFYSFAASVNYYAFKIRPVLYKLLVKMKEIHNDPDVEHAMLDQSRMFTKLYFRMYVVVMVFYGLDSLMHVINEGETFVTMVTAWPDLYDRSPQATIARILIYIFWCLAMCWFASVYLLAIPLTIAISYQFRNLQSYFYNLNVVFESDDDQIHKELNYERALKIGIKAHADTLWCKNEVQSIFSILYGGQIIHNVFAITALMYQMVTSDRSITMLLTVAITAASVLLSTGCLMWKAGDVTFEAAQLPTAFFGSGWQNCTKGTSIRVRALIVISMAVSQIPVEFQGLGIVPFSYDSYVNIVKSSYSVFSVLY